MGPLKGNARNRQGGAGRNQGGDVALDLRVERQHMDDHLHFVEEAFREQRADGAVDQARGQGLELAGTAFALEKAAGNAAGGIGFFQVIHRQGEKVLAWLGIGLGDHGGQHDGAVHVHQHSATRLAGDFTGFHGDRVLAPGEGFADFVENTHVFTLSWEMGHEAAPGARMQVGLNTMPFQKTTAKWASGLVE
jgi:hypothetical protein